MHPSFYGPPSVPFLSTRVSRANRFNSVYLHLCDKKFPNASLCNFTLYGRLQYCLVRLSADVIRFWPANLEGMSPVTSDPPASPPVLSLVLPSLAMYTYERALGTLLSRSCQALFGGFDYAFIRSAEGVHYHSSGNFGKLTCLFCSQVAEPCPRRSDSPSTTF